MTLSHDNIREIKPGIAFIDSAAEHVVPEQQLDDIEIGRILSAVGYETPALIISALPHIDKLSQLSATDAVEHKYTTTKGSYDAAATGGQVEIAMRRLQGTSPVGDYSKSYFSARLRTLATNHPYLVNRHSGDKFGASDLFQLTEGGFWLARPVAGWLLKWGYDFNMPLRSMLGEAKPGILSPDGQNIVTPDSVLIRLGVLAALLEARGKGVTVENVCTRNELPFGARSVAGHMDKLSEGGITAKGSNRRDIPYSLQRDKREAVEALLSIYVRMANFDEGFYRDGHRHADTIISNPGTVAYLMKRVVRTSNRVRPKESSSTSNTLGKFANRFV